MKNVYDILKERGFISQTTADDEIHDMVSKEKIAGYIGFDPTATSLHAGSLVPLMALAHLQRAGHRAIAVMGNGTAMIGDPSGKTEMRKILSPEEIFGNVGNIAEQVRPFIGEHGLVVHNADWLLELNYVDFLREIGRHFSVNRMLSFESYKVRLEKGLSFLEFNYQLLQAYDYLTLFQKHGCTLQMGGDDQWGNIVAGIDLIRRVAGKPAFGLTFPLLETASGQKMGKTAQGAVWLDPALTSPYEFYQYFRNTHDMDVGRNLALFTFLPMNEVRELAQLKDAATNQAKKILAFEITKIVHGVEQAEKAQQAAQSAFRGTQEGASGIPTTQIHSNRLEPGVLVVDLFTEVGLCKSKSDARRLISQGGMRVGDRRIDGIEQVVSSADFEGGAVLLRAGKKKVHRITIRESE